MKQSYMLLYFLVLLWHVIYQRAALSAAAGLLISSKRRHHITLILASLHWLPVSFMIYFKIWLITFSACQGLAPSYILDLLTAYEPLFSLKAPGKNRLTLALLHQLKQRSPSVNRTVEQTFSTVSQHIRNFKKCIL